MLLRIVTDLSLEHRSQNFQTGPTKRQVAGDFLPVVVELVRVPVYIPFVVKHARVPVSLGEFCRIPLTASHFCRLPNYCINTPLDIGFLVDQMWLIS